MRVVEYGLRAEIIVQCGAISVDVFVLYRYVSLCETGPTQVGFIGVA